MSGPLRIACTCLLAAAGMTGAWAQAGIYTCIDAGGRRLTSDRPIAECADRTQKELNPSGTVRRLIAPAPTAREVAVLEQKKRQAAEEQRRRQEQLRVEKLLVARYPNQAMHDLARARALQAVQESVAAGEQRIADLREQRSRLDGEAEFYPSPAEWPDKLKRQFADSEQQIAAQQRFIAAQEDEKKRMGAQYDAELARLKVLWTRTAATTAAAPAAASEPLAR